MAATGNIHVDHVGSLLRPKELEAKRFELLGVHDADHNLAAHDNAQLTEIENPKLERGDDLKRRIEEASKNIAIEQIGICPQCGFSTNVFGTEFTIDDEKRKIEMMVRVAREVWG